MLLLLAEIYRKLGVKLRMFIGLLLCVNSLYFVALLYMSMKFKQATVPAPTTAWPSVALAVCIAARNEAHNLEALFAALEAQTYQNFSVYLADDHSADNTYTLAVALAEKANTAIHIIKAKQAGKKGALSAAIQATPAATDFIVTTDADCTPPPTWLKSIAQKLAYQQELVLLSGPVCYTTANFWHKLLSVEQSSLVGIGAASIVAGSPGMCNGANLCFSKKAWQNVNGYTQHQHLASGDDEFLLQSLSKKYPERIAASMRPESLVPTAPPATFPQFMHQRIRWASKWRHHKGFAPKMLAASIFVFYLMQLVSVAVAVTGAMALNVFIALHALRLVGDSAFLATVRKKLKLPLYAWSYPLLTLIYPLYAVFFGLAATFANYSWKDRNY